MNIRNVIRMDKRNKIRLGIWIAFSVTVWVYGLRSLCNRLGIRLPTFVNRLGIRIVLIESTSRMTASNRISMNPYMYMAMALTTMINVNRISIRRRGGEVLTV